MILLYYFTFAKNMQIYIILDYYYLTKNHVQYLIKRIIKYYIDFSASIYSTTCFNYYSYNIHII